MQAFNPFYLEILLKLDGHHYFLTKSWIKVYPLTYRCKNLFINKILNYLLKITILGVSSLSHVTYKSQLQFTQN